MSKVNGSYEVASDYPVANPFSLYSISSASFGVSSSGLIAPSLAEWIGLRRRRRARWLLPGRTFNAAGPGCGQLLSQAAPR